MSSRDIASSILDSLSEEQIAADRGRKRYSDFSEIEKEILSDEEISA